MRPVSLKDQGLVKAVRQLAQQWSEQTAVAAQVNAIQERPLPLQLEQALYRIAQESLQNIGKHAQASTVTIDLQYTSTAVLLQVTDDGIGFDTNKTGVNSSFGLQNMKQRTAALGGKFALRSTPEGTTIQARLPIKTQKSKL